MTTNKPTERPIIFSGEMVRAILDGRKTQTRRVVKPRRRWPIDFIGGIGMKDDPTCWGFEDGEGKWWALKGDDQCDQIPCPYGQRGDKLWVREAWRTGWSYGGDCPTVQYRATETAHVGSEEYPVIDVQRGKFGISDPTPHAIVPGGKWKPSIHMPRWASRITLEVVNVRVERLQDISETGARAEGVDQTPRDTGAGYFPRNPIGLFADLWESINGPGSWDQNPWVWVIEFRRIEP